MSFRFFKNVVRYYTTAYAGRKLLNANGTWLIFCLCPCGHASKSNPPLRLTSKIISYNATECHLHTSRCHKKAQRTVRINYKLSRSSEFIVGINVSLLFSLWDVGYANKISINKYSHFLLKR